LEEKKVKHLRKKFKTILKDILMLDFGEDGYYESDLDEWVSKLIYEVIENK